MTSGDSNFSDFPEINLSNFVQFKQYHGKSGPRRRPTTRYFVQSNVVNIYFLNTNTVGA